jgi:hypothetical protein
MMKRLSLLLAALFVASMVLVAPVFASGNHENNNGEHKGNNEKVCVLHKDKGDEHNNGEHKDYRWVSQDNKDHGDKVVKDKFCEHKNNRGEHRDHNGEHKDNNGEHKDNNGEHKGDNGDNGHANNNDDDNGHANNNDDDWS